VLNIRVRLLTRISDAPPERRFRGREPAELVTSANDVQYDPYNVNMNSDPVTALEPKIREFCARCLDPRVGASRFDFAEQDQEFIRDRGNEHEHGVRRRRTRSRCRGWNLPAPCSDNSRGPGRIRRESSSTTVGSAKNESRYVRCPGDAGKRAGSRRRVMMAGGRVAAARRRGQASSHWSDRTVIAGRTPPGSRLTVLPTLGRAGRGLRSNGMAGRQANLAWETLLDLSATKPGPLHMRLAAAIRAAIRDGRPRAPGAGRRVVLSGRLRSVFVPP
jgi:hypothetical protein